MCYLCYLQTVPSPTPRTVKKQLCCSSVLAAAGSDALKWNIHFQEKTCLCLRTWACRHSPSSTAFEEYIIFKPLNHLQACVLCSRHFTSPWAICFRRQNNSVSQELINKFTTSCGWLGKQQHGWMLRWYGFNVELSEVQVPGSSGSLITEHNFFCCRLPAPKRQLCFLPFNETVL